MTETTPDTPETGFTDYRKVVGYVEKPHENIAILACGHRKPRNGLGIGGHALCLECKRMREKGNV